VKETGTDKGHYVFVYQGCRNGMSIPGSVFNLALFHFAQSLEDYYSLQNKKTGPSSPPEPAHRKGLDDLLEEVQATAKASSG
jgi:hypothetical protein